MSADLDAQFESLVWQGRSTDLAGLPRGTAHTWAGSVQSDMIVFRRAAANLAQPSRRGKPFSRACLIMMAKDESDILPTNLLWHHAIGFRRMIVSDNNSSDESLKLLFDLRSKLADTELIIVSDPIQRYLQAQKMTGLLELANNIWEDSEWIFPIDADELLIAPNGLELLNDVPAMVDALVLSKANHFLHVTAEPRCPAPVIGSMMPLRTLLGSQPPKVAVRAKRGMALSQGNHQAFAESGQNVTYAGGLALGLYIREFQMRSFAQFKRKVIDGSTATMLADEHLGYSAGCDHWKTWMRLYREQGEGALSSIFQTFVRSSDGMVFDPLAMNYIGLS